MNAHRHIAGHVMAGLLIVLQAGCDTSTGPVSLTMSIDPTTITLGQSATITWEWHTPEGGFCDASGAWHGSKKAKNSNVVTPTEIGTLVYELECFEDIDATNHRSRSASVTLTVNPAAASNRAVAASSVAVEYAFTTIDYPGADRTEAYGINNAGQIVGYYFDATGQHGFVKDGDSYTAFDAGPDGTSALGISDVPQVVGFVSDHGFLKTGDIIESITVPSSYFTVAWGINNAGHVVGTFNDDFGTHGFLKDGGDIVQIDGPEALFTEATGINDGGEIVGNTISSTGQFQAFRLSEGLMSVIEVPGAPTVEAHDINQLGEVAGSFLDGNGVAHGFVMGDSGISILDAPGAATPGFTQAKGVNDDGHVVGWYDEGGGIVHGFLAVPIDAASVTIDIAPGNARNVLNPWSRGLVWVGILSSTDVGHEFDPVSRVDASTVRFGPAGAGHVRIAARDVNRDGLADLLLQFRMREAGLGCDATSASLAGATSDGQRFSGSDSVTVVACR